MIGPERTPSSIACFVAGGRASMETRSRRAGRADRLRLTVPKLPIPRPERQCGPVAERGLSDLGVEQEPELARLSHERPVWRPQLSVLLEEAVAHEPAAEAAQQKRVGQGQRRAEMHGQVD